MTTRRLVLAALAILAWPLATAGLADEPKLSEAAGWLQAYLRVDTTNPPGNEAAAAAFLAEIARREGFAVERYVSPTGRTSLVARLPATGGTARAPETVVLLHHADVVPAGEGWSVPPFSGAVRDGAVWGRGAIDAKGLGVAHLAALVDLARGGSPRHREFLFVAAADEENGGGEGIAWLWQRHPELFRGAVAVLNEGGLNRQVLGRPLWWGIELVQKRPLWLELTARGRPGHAAGLNPHSAAHQLIAALARLVARRPEWKVGAAARLHFTAVAALDPNVAALASDLDRVIDRDGPRRQLLPGMPAYFLDTVQVTTLEGSERINVVAGQARAQVDIRLLPETDGEAFLAGVRETLGPEIEVRVLLSAPPAPASSTGTATYRALAAELAAEAPVLPGFLAGVTDSRYFRERGIAAYGFSPFQLEGNVLSGVHGPDERMPLAEFERGVARLKRIVRRLASGG